METAFKRKTLFLVFVVLQLIIGVLFYKCDVMKEILIHTKYHTPSVNPNNQINDIHVDQRTADLQLPQAGMQINRTKSKIYRHGLNVKMPNATDNRDTLENLTKFDITPDYDGDRVFLLMMVTTTPNSFKRRHVIRTTWGGTNKQIKMERTALFNGRNLSIAIKLAFVLGVSGDENTDNQVRYEAGKFGDILRVSIEESYRNIVYKILGAYSWAETIEPWFILKSDHDVYINVRKLIDWLLEPSIPQLLYSGYVHSKAYIDRKRGNPHYVSKEDYGNNVFPDYCAGPCYVISRKFLSEINEVAKGIKIFRVEDAFFGVIANHLHIKPFETKFFMWDRTLNNKIRKWNDSDFSQFICLGDSLNTDAIDYLHFKYMQL